MRATSASGAGASAAGHPQGRRCWVFEPERWFWHDPALDDERLYAGSGDGSVYGIDKASGALTWQVGIGDETESAPTLIAGLVLIAGGDGCLHALDARSGNRRWRAGPYWSILAAACADATQAVVACYDGGVRALDLQTGALRWCYQRDGGRRFGPAARAGELLYVGGENCLLTALTWATGQEAWSRSLDDILYAAPVAAAGMVYAATWLGALHALDAATGHTVWCSEYGGEVHGAPVYAAGTLYFADGMGTLHALDPATGAARWSRAGTYALPCWANGRLYCLAEHTLLCALDAADGVLQWQLEVPRAHAAPAIGGGVIYLGTKRGLHAVS